MSKRPRSPRTPTIPTHKNDSKPQEDENKSEEVSCTSELLARTRPLPAPGQRIAVPKNKVGTHEIYKRFPAEYDLLMSRHDCSLVQAKLVSVLEAVVHSASEGGVAGVPSSSFRATIGDFGCGTGRLSCMLAARDDVGAVFAYDKAPEMLKRCHHNVTQCAAAANRAVVVMDRDSDSRVGDEETVVVPAPSTSSGLAVCVRPFSFEDVERGCLRGHRRLNIVMCGWALTYVMRACWGGTKWHERVEGTVRELVAAVDTSAADGYVVIVETLGNGCTEPTRQNVMMEFLVERFGFECMWVRTDYRFESAEEAADMSRFFFGDKVAQVFRDDGATPVLHECTGIWTLKVPRKKQVTEQEGPGEGTSS